VREVLDDGQRQQLVHKTLRGQRLEYGARLAQAAGGTVFQVRAIPCGLKAPTGVAEASGVEYFIRAASPHR
jgi:hypothetical protein